MVLILHNVTVDLDDKDISHMYRQTNYAKAKNDSIICNIDNGSSNDINLIDTNSNGNNLANHYTKPKPKSASGFLSRGNRYINAIKRNSYKM